LSCSGKLVIYPSVETVGEILLLRICAVSVETRGFARYPSFLAAAFTVALVASEIRGWLASARETVGRENPVSSAI
jgi:hypothetical protein